MLAAPALQRARGSGDGRDADQHPARRRADPAAGARQPADARARPGLRVLLPTRPNGASGWISGTTRRSCSPRPGRWWFRWPIGACTRLRRGRLVRSFPVVIGAPSTPTPTGRFAVAERIQLPDPDPVLRLLDAHADRPLERAQHLCRRRRPGGAARPRRKQPAACRWGRRPHTAVYACETPTSTGWPVTPRPARL